MRWEGRGGDAVPLPRACSVGVMQAPPWAFGGAREKSGGAALSAGRLPWERPPGGSGAVPALPLPGRRPTSPAGGCMGHCFLRGVLRVLLRPSPPARARPRVLGLESVPLAKRPRGSLMAPPRIGTHSGTFHCDEALACALLRLLPEYRVRSAPRKLTPGPLRASRAGRSRAPLLTRSPGNLPCILRLHDPGRPSPPVSPAGCRDCADPGPRKTGFL